MNPININGLEIVVSGKLIKIARPLDEWDVDITEPHVIIEQLKQRDARVDVLTFAQRLPHTLPLFDYHFKMDNVAAIPISTYEAWWEGANRRVRLKVNKANRLGIVVKLCEFDDELVWKIKEIFDESPLRQGVPFLHYNKSFSYVKERMGTYSDRSDFFGAYFGEELIGILKVAYSSHIARMMTLIGKTNHRDKAPVNALLAKAVDACVQRGVSYLTYGKFTYNKKGLDDLAHFKVHNGFSRFDLPRYYIPVSALGRIVVAMRLYNRPSEVAPGIVVRFVRDLRKRWYQANHKRSTDRS